MLAFAALFIAVSLELVGRLVFCFALYRRSQPEGSSLFFSVFRLNRTLSNALHRNGHGGQKKYDPHWRHGFEDAFSEVVDNGHRKKRDLHSIRLNIDTERSRDFSVTRDH